MYMYMYVYFSNSQNMFFIFCFITPLENVYFWPHIDILCLYYCNIVVMGFARTHAACFPKNVHVHVSVAGHVYIGKNIIHVYNVTF